jgi:hypothetical protein
MYLRRASVGGPDEEWVQARLGGHVTCGHMHVA